MNYSKIILVGFISAFVAILTSVLGVAGTVIGSVISSVLYNMLSEALEKPVSNVSIKHEFEWDVAYVFPLIVIALIQLLLICSFLAEWGILPGTFLNVYLSLQDFADNNLYRILGLALIIISVYPLFLKPENVKKVHGVIIAIVGIIFLARGFVDFGNPVTNLYHPIFEVFDFPIAVIAFILLVTVIVRILSSAWNSDHSGESVSEEDVKGFVEKNKFYRQQDEGYSDRKVIHVRRKPQYGDSNYRRVAHSKSQYQNKATHKHHRNSKFSKNLSNEKASKPQQDVKPEPVEKGHKINKSSKNIQFESNDLLDEYKR